jgi:hypothetical protein
MMLAARKPTTYARGHLAASLATLVVLAGSELQAQAQNTKLEAQIDGECKRVCRPLSSYGVGLRAHGARNPMSDIAERADPFLASSDCPLICRQLGGHYPTLDAGQVLMAMAFRCAMPLLPAAASVPISQCVANGPPDPSELEKYPRQSLSGRGVAGSSAEIVSLEDESSIGEGWSRGIVFLVLPLFPALCAAFGLAAAVKHERKRREILDPPAYQLLANGTVGDPRQTAGPVVEVAFELTSTNQGDFEKARRIDVHPFAINTADGRRIHVRVSRDNVNLHAPVTGHGGTWASTIKQGDQVWVYGRRTEECMSSATVSSAQPPTSNLEIAGDTHPVLISTTPLELVFGKDRDRRLSSVAKLIGFIAFLGIVFFHGYFDLSFSGREMFGRVIDKSSHWSTTSVRSGARKIQVFTAMIEAEGTSQRFEVDRAGWEQAQTGSLVTVLLSPRVMVLGHQPYTTLGRAALAMVLELGAIFVYLFIGRRDSAWYSATRGWQRGDPLVDQAPPQQG